MDRVEERQREPKHFCCLPLCVCHMLHFHPVPQFCRCVVWLNQKQLVKKHALILAGLRGERPSEFHCMKSCIWTNLQGPKEGDRSADCSGRSRGKPSEPMDGPEGTHAALSGICEHRSSAEGGLGNSSALQPPFQCHAEGAGAAGYRHCLG